MKGDLELEWGSHSSLLKESWIKCICHIDHIVEVCEDIKDA